MKTIPLIKPYITQETKDRICEVLDSGHITEGQVTRRLEKAFSDYVGALYAVATTSCTTGLEIALRAIGVGPGDEVIVPDYTYPATACVVNIVGAKVVLVDIDRETMLIDYGAIENAISPATKAVLPVSLFGNPLDYGRLLEIKKQHNILIIEDAACAIGAEYDGVKVGNLGDMTVFSMHPRKFITTGEGGMVTTNDRHWADWMVSYKHFGMGSPTVPGICRFETIGTNYKLSDLLSAVGLMQIGHIDSLLAQRIALAERYDCLLGETAGVERPKTTSKGKHAYQSYCVFVEKRDAVMKRLRQLGIEVQIGTYALHREKAFLPGTHCEWHSEMTNSEYAFEHCLALPLFHQITESEQETVVGALKKAIEATTGSN